MQEGDSSSSAAADEPEASASGAAEDGAKRGQIGFPADSEIGRWRDELLRGGEAGEDSLMCTSMGSAGDVAIGVADGVGGWTENGIDPSLFSQALMFYASKAAASAPAGSSSTNSNGAPNRILAEAFEHVLKEPLVVAGSATACILTMDASNGTLHSANLGDSGFVILRQARASTASSTPAHHSSSASTRRSSSPSCPKSGFRKAPSPTRPRTPPTGSARFSTATSSSSAPTASLTTSTQRLKSPSLPSSSRRNTTLLRRTPRGHR